MEDTRVACEFLKNYTLESKREYIIFRREYVNLDMSIFSLLYHEAGIQCSFTDKSSHQLACFEFKNKPSIPASSSLWFN